MNKFITTILTLSIITFVISCTDLDEDLKGVITSDISVEGIATDDGGRGGDALGGAFAGLRNTGTAGHTNWYSAQELTSDEMVVTTKGGDWYDGGWLIDFHQHNYKNTNPSVNNNWNSHYGAVATTNELLAAGLDANGTAQIKALRAYYFWRLMDMYGRIKLPTSPGQDAPQSTRTEAFNFIESELLASLGVSAVSASMDLSGSALGTDKNPYRLNQFGVLGILAKLYLNAEVWIGEDHYTDAITYANQVINSSYRINTVDANGNGSAYDELFLADNDSNGAQDEFIFALNFDGNSSRTYGGTTFLVHAAIGGDMDASKFGVNGGWSGLRTTKALVNKFDYAVTASDEDGNPTEWADKRAMFFTEGQNLEINTIANTFTDGYAVTKFKNIDSEGNAGSDAGGDFVDTDLPVIRMAEIYLTYAEAVTRGGSGGNIQQAVGYINELRERAFGNADGNISSSDLNIDFVLDERARELYWEGQRRTDLIRYNDFTTGSYLWPFKGGSKSGTSVSDYRVLFPLPSNIILINPNLTQNTGY